LLQELENIFSEHMKFGEGLSLVLSIWTLHTYMYQGFSVTPYLWLHSPVRGCGKTTLCRLLHDLSADAHFTVGISKAALYRIIEAQKPTLIMDEAEGLTTDREMLSLINAGYSRATGTVLRAHKDGLRSYQVYCPKVIASIQPIPHTIVDRSIKIELQRLLETDMVVPLHEDDESVGQDLLPAMHEWVSEHRNEIARTYRSPRTRLEFLHGRQADIWRPLFAIASVLCPGRLEELQATALRLTDEKRRFEQETSPEINLLRDCQEVFGNLDNPGKLPTEALITGLASLPESAWLNLTSLDLSKKLLPFGIRPGQHWIGGRNFRGYARANFLDAFARYLPAPQQLGAKPARGARPAGLKAV
jgi:putative DNA primase/helicase